MRNVKHLQGLLSLIDEATGTVDRERFVGRAKDNEAMVGAWDSFSRTENKPRIKKLWRRRPLLRAICPTHLWGDEPVCHFRGKFEITFKNSRLHESVGEFCPVSCASIDILFSK